MPGTHMFLAAFPSGFCISCSSAGLVYLVSISMTNLISVCNSSKSSRRWACVPPHV